jgi:hypothetical protein
MVADQFVYGGQVAFGLRLRLGTIFIRVAVISQAIRVSKKQTEPME